MEPYAEVIILIYPPQRRTESFPVLLFSTVWHHIKGTDGEPKHMGLSLLWKRTLTTCHTHTTLLFQVLDMF